MHSENVGTAAMETLDWAPFSTMTSGVNAQAAIVSQQGDPATPRGFGKGGTLSEKKVKAWIANAFSGGRGGGGRGGGKQDKKPGGRGLKKQPQPRKSSAQGLKNICDGWNSGACVDLVCPNNQRHACVRCGKKGGKIGHAGCKTPGK